MRGLALAACLVAGGALAQEPAPSSSPAPPRPILNAIDPAVEKWWRETREPCDKPINKGVPCFAVEVHAEGPTVSVRDSLWNLGTSRKPAERRPPTVEEMAPMRPGPKSTVAGVGMTLDPVCAAKAAWKAVKGRNDKYFLYRLRDAKGERVVMRDAKLDATAYQGSAEFLGEFTGECEAIAAFRHEDRR